MTLFNFLVVTVVVLAFVCFFLYISKLKAKAVAVELMEEKERLAAPATAAKEKEVRVAWLRNAFKHSGPMGGIITTDHNPAYHVNQNDFSYNNGIFFLEGLIRYDSARWNKLFVIPSLTEEVLVVFRKLIDDKSSSDNFTFDLKTYLAAGYFHIELTVCGESVIFSDKTAFFSYTGDEWNKITDEQVNYVGYQLANYFGDRATEALGLETKYFRLNPTSLWIMNSHFRSSETPTTAT